jgi:hypothetical protein
MIQCLLHVSERIPESFSDALQELSLMLQGLCKSCIYSLREALGIFGEILDGCHPVTGLSPDPGVLVGGFANEASNVARPGHDCEVEISEGFFGSGHLMGLYNEDTF